MMHDTDPLEEELRRLQPAETPGALEKRLAAALAAPASPVARARTGLRNASLWLSWGIAAAMTIAFLSRADIPVDSRGPAAPSSASTPEDPAAPGDGSVGFAPVSTSNVLLGALDEGVVYLEDGRPARKVRYEFLDTVRLRSTDTGRATVNVSYPREEIRLVPLQTF